MDSYLDFIGLMFILSVPSFHLCFLIHLALHFDWIHGAMERYMDRLQDGSLWSKIRIVIFYLYYALPYYVARKYAARKPGIRTFYTTMWAVGSFMMAYVVSVKDGRR